MLAEVATEFGDVRASSRRMASAPRQGTPSPIRTRCRPGKRPSRISPPIVSTAHQPTAWRSAPISGARLISCCRDSTSASTRQLDLALGHAGGGQAGRAPGSARNRAQRARGGGARLRAVQALDPPRDRDAAGRALAPARERESTARAARTGVTRASVRRYDGRMTKHPLGRELFWFTVTGGGC